MSEMLEKIRKILAKAEGTDNVHEADAFLQKAQKLARQHAIDLETVRQSSTGKSSQPERKVIHIGAPGKQGNTLLIALLAAVGLANDVTFEASSKNTYAVAYGFPSDIEVVETLFTHLSLQMIQAANDYLKTGSYKRDGVHGKSARKTFYIAFVNRIHARLTEANEAADQEATGTSTAMVLVGKRDEVEKFRKGMSKATTKWRGPSSQRSQSKDALQAGDQAGRNARLSDLGALDGDGANSKAVTR